MSEPKKPLPANLYVFRQNEGEGEDEYLDVNANSPEETAEFGVERLVGIYSLTKTVLVNATAEVRELS